MKIPIPLFRRKKFLIGLFTLIFISIPIGFLSLKYARPTAAAWFDDSWAYRKAIAIPSHTAVENNVYVTVPSFDATDTSRFQADCGDLRFTKQNGELLPYYVVTCSATANIHVQFDTLPAGASTYFMYYGNPSADNGFSAADFSTAASGLGTQTLASEEKSQGPAAYWKFDEGYGTVANDSTANANTGNLGVGSSAPEWRPESDCLSGKCLYFDGTNDYLSVGTTVPGIKTVSFWIKPITTSEQFIDLNGSAYIQASSGTISATGFTSPTIYVDGIVSSTLVANKWQYVTVTTGTALSGSAIKIGKISTNFGQGFFDEVKIYPYSRTPSEIRSDFVRGARSPHGAAAVLGGSKDQGDFLSQGLVGYWKMDETSWNGTAGEVIDSSGNANHSVGVGATPPTTGSGKFGNAGSFDRIDDYLPLTNLAVNTAAGAKTTVSFWMYWDGVTGKMPFGWTTYDLWFGGTCFGFNTGESNVLGFSNTVIPSNTWTHVAAVFYNGVPSAANNEIYINGVKQTLTACTGSTAASRTVGTTATIANWNNMGSYFFGGKLDEFRIYNRALSPKEVRDLYNWAPGPVAHLKMDEGSGVSANDDSGNSRTGTLNDGASWTTGKFGKGVKLDGTNDDVSIGDFGY